MSRLKKDCKPVYMKMASDAADLLKRYCEASRFDATFAIENLIRLHVPIMLKRQKARTPRTTTVLLEAIKDEISRLSRTERASLAEWLDAQEAELWDGQIEAHFSEGGAGMALLEQWDGEIESSQSIALDDFLDEKRRS